MTHLSCRVQSSPDWHRKLLRSLAGDRQLSFIPRRHAASEDTHSRKAFPSQDLCRSDRAALLVSDGHDGSCAVGCEFAKPIVKLRQGHEDRLINVSSLPDELVRVPYIEHQR